MTSATGAPVSPQGPNDRLRSHKRSVTVWRLHCQGYKQHEIAARLGVNKSTVCRYIRKVETFYRDLVDSKTTHRHRARQIAELALIRREAWEAWEASKLAAEEEAISVTSDGSTNNDGSTAATSRTATRKTKKRTGDRGYLEVILNTMRSESALLGLDAPTQHAVDLRVGKDIEMLTDEELYSIARQGPREIEDVTPLAIEPGTSDDDTTTIE